MKLVSRLFLSGITLSCLGLSAQSALAADVPLYPTGPAEDSSFVRFIDGGSRPVDVTAAESKARLTLDPASPASPFFPVAAGKPVSGTLSAGSARAKVSETVRPGEFVSIVALDGTGEAGSLYTVTVRERPDKFNALKASMALYNLDASCAAPTLKVPDLGIVLLDDVSMGQGKRREINPVALSVQLVCGGKPLGQPLRMGTLVAGGRYTVFLVPGRTHSQLFFANDTVGR